jgi:hypothetical protein
MRLGLISPLVALSMTLVLAPPDARAGSAETTGPVAEIVTFRLLPGIDDAAFLTAARATEAPIARQPGFLHRTLSRDETGLWTDYVEWTDLASANAAAQAVMALPELGPFFAAVEPEGTVIRHAPILWQMSN